MFRRTALALTALPLVFCSAASAQQVRAAISVEAGPLPAALQNLQRQTGAELLFDPRIVAGLRSAPVEGALATDAALRLLLAETNLTVRRASSGAWIVERTNAAPLEQLDAAVTEIVVIGRRTNNVDIRRTESDVQPYTVITKEELRSAHRDTLGQYFDHRVTLNTTAIPITARSSVNLRGLGADNTLLLLDGRRMPSSPFPGNFAQADINNVPLHAVERIEVLSGAAGGIYGFGALGGVVNVVLDREHRGFDLYVTEGVSSRGDGRRQSYEASFGLTSPDRATDFTIFAARMEGDAIRAGDRDYLYNDRRETLAIAPDVYLSPFSFELPHGNSITVMSSFGDPLQLKPEYGGGTLSSSFTFLPAGLSGDPTEIGALLAQNAGLADIGLTAGDRDNELMPNTNTDSVLLNLRRRFDSGFELFADAALFRTTGVQRDPRSTGDAFISPSSPANPFTDYIDISFPAELLYGSSNRYRIENTRYTVGAIADLPLGWRGAAEVTWGASKARVITQLDFAPSLFMFGSSSDPDIAPFGNWDTFQQALAQDVLMRTTIENHETRLEYQALRIAGPAFDTGAGAATLTLLAEHRYEAEGPSLSQQIDDRGGAPTTAFTLFGAEHTDVTSLYAELRAPLFDDQAFPLVRGLELQLAARHDHWENAFPSQLEVPNSPSVEVAYAEAAYTAGLKVSPAPWLTLRGSYATGHQPPATSSLRTMEDLVFDFPFAFDAKRPGAFVGDVPVAIQMGGSPDMEMTRAESYSIGAIFSPFGEDGARLALDYSRIVRSNDLSFVLFTDILDNEDAFPGRVTRAPLSADDILQGYTVGAVTGIDGRYVTGASLETSSIDLRAEWPVSFHGGRLRFYGDASYILRNRVRDVLAPFVERTDLLSGPLKLRANGGVDWRREDVMLGANVQFYGSYSTRQPGLFPGDFDDSLSIAQGSSRIPAQTYVDFYASWRLPVPRHDIVLDFGILNAFDEAPPRQTMFEPFGIVIDDGFSRYGDPRQRRFEITLQVHF